MASQHSATQAGERLVLTIKDITQLFTVPAGNPFSDCILEVHGQPGIEYVHLRIKRSWLASTKVGELVVRLPAHQLPSESDVLHATASQTQSAVRRYCQERMSVNRLERSIAVSSSLRQMVFAALLLLVSIVYGTALVNDWLTILPPFLRGVLFILTLLATSLAIWDALGSLLFQWVPFVTDNRAYRTLADAKITLEPYESPNTGPSSEQVRESDIMKP